MPLGAGYKPFVREGAEEGGRDAERKHNKSRVARMATRLCYVGEPAELTPQARDSQID